jgi:hypothetical protein
MWAVLVSIVGGDEKAEAEREFIFSFPV